MNFYDRLKLGMTAEEPEKQSEVPVEYTVEDTPVKCPHCGEGQFSLGTAQLNTAGMTFLHLDWADKTAYTLVCAHCGHIEWFAQEPAKR